MSRTGYACVLLAAALIPACSGNVAQFVLPMAPVVALAHVRVIDGTGGPGKDDQTVIIERDATSFKAYTTLRASELKAAIAAAHDRGLTITGHLCAVGFREAAALGIDNLEHGVAVDSEFYAGKRPDECPDQSAAMGAVLRMDTGDSDIRQTIEVLVRHGVAVTSTLAVFESYAIDESEIDPRVPALMSARLRDAFQDAREGRKDRTRAGQSQWAALLHQEMAFERAFVAAGGKLLAGADPTGWGGIAAGYADQRGLELLVSAGFSPEQSIAIATSNGARFLGDRIVGRIAEGMQADLVVLRGNPSRHISDVRNVEIVFKDGVAYDPERLVTAAAGTLGELTLERLFTWPVTVGLALLALLGARRATSVLRRRRPALAA
jgi:hypothetical protein